MASIAHPETGDSIEVTVVDRESHFDYEAVQVEAVDDGVELTDKSGNAPWVPEDEVDGLEN